MKTRRTIVIPAAFALALASGRPARPDDPRSSEDIVQKWDALPPEELRALWDEAQGTGGVVAVEPDTEIVGRRAAQKKTWTLADKLLKFFVYGDQPNWFPADLVRRTVCGPDPRWAYFWHLLSGDERDLHPWLDGEKGFRDLLGEQSGALTGSGALNLASCEEVQGPSKSCLYGEVTPPEKFEQWFCGGRGSSCLEQLKASPQEVPADLRRPAEFCMHGPWVLERVHEWRPEIHPAEVFWARANRGRNLWTFALVPDDSDRFGKDKYFENAPSGRAAAAWRPWSSDRPVELWVAFSGEGAKPLVFDLAEKAFDRQPQTRQATLTPPAAGAGFTVLPHTLPGVLVVAKSWTEPSCNCTHGLLVLRTTVRKGDRQALVLRLNGRSPDEPPPLPEIEGTAPPAGLVAPVAPRAVAPSLRLFGVAKLGPAVRPGSVAVNALVRFDPRRPTEPADEQAVDRKNEALRGKAADRQREFGSERPFRVQWEIQATRDDTGEPVSISAPGIGPIGGGTSEVQVEVLSFPGPATAAVLVNGQDLSAGLAGKATLVSLGQLMVTVPRGVTVTGQGRIYYQGMVPLDIPSPAARVGFRVPPRRYTGEWDLVSQVLSEIDPARSANRLARLQESACAPAPAAECPAEPLSPKVAASLADPVARWRALRELRAGDRSFARFVRLFARGLLWDGEVSDDERELMKRLLQASEASVVAEAYRQAWQRPGDDAARDQLAAVLPRFEGYAVVEGDILMTEGELRRYAEGKFKEVEEEKSRSPQPAAPRGELKVNTESGVPTYWPVDARQLTYAVDRASFADDGQYQVVVANVGTAARAWMEVCPTCGLALSHLSEHDAAPSLDKVSFIVRGVDAAGAYIAAAFFPNYPPSRRYLNVDPAYFSTTFDKVGVFRHELGHVLGYRHEHISGVPGCYTEAQNWLPVTPYDPYSVMHYVCGGRGSRNLELTEEDKTGHRKLYAVP